LTGTYQPRDRLAAFRGENPNGTWVLNVSDTAAGESGIVRDVSLEVFGYACNQDQASQDLSLSMSGAPNPVEVETGLTYTLNVANGATASTNVQVIDTLPAGVNFVSATASQGSCSQLGSIVTCSLGSMRAFGVAHVTIVVEPQDEGEIENTATVSSSEVDPELSNNTAETTTLVTHLADLIITNTDSPDPIPLGGSTTYTIKVTNQGPSAATGVTVTTQLSNGGTQPHVIGNLAANASATVSVNGSGSAAGTITVEASVAANEVDPQPSNNFAVQSTRVVTLHSLLVSKPQVSGCPTNDFGRAVGTVRLNSAAPAGGAVVTLTNTNPKIDIPASVTVPAGGSFAEFTIAANGTVLSSQSGQITATYAGTNKSQSITVRPISVDFINTSVFEIFGGQSFSANVVLECSSSPVAIDVVLSTDLPSVAFISSPSSGIITIPAGQQNSSSFTVQTNSVVTATFVNVQGTANGRTGTGTVRVKP